VIDDRVAVDAGSLGQSVGSRQRQQVRDVVLTHAHLDHIAGLPLFLDDLFSVLEAPVRIHATPEVISILERDVFNWSIYPRFSELSNEHGAILQYVPFQTGAEFSVAHLKFQAISVNHRVPAVGFVISDEKTRIVMTGDTAGLDDFWQKVNSLPRPGAVLIECAFPDELAELAEVSHHLTPSRLRNELDKFAHTDIPVYVINIKPMFCEKVVRQIEELNIENLHVLDVGRVYEW
jgi:cAMP phosphodiesterase